MSCGNCGGLDFVEAPWVAIYAGLHIVGALTRRRGRRRQRTPPPRTAVVAAISGRTRCLPPSASVPTHPPTPNGHEATLTTRCGGVRGDLVIPFVAIAAAAAAAPADGSSVRLFLVSFVLCFALVTLLLGVARRHHGAGRPWDHPEDATARHIVDGIPVAFCHRRHACHATPTRADRRGDGGKGDGVHIWSVAPSRGPACCPHCDRRCRRPRRGRRRPCGRHPHRGRPPRTTPPPARRRRSVPRPSHRPTGGAPLPPRRHLRDRPAGAKRVWRPNRRGAHRLPSRRRRLARPPRRRRQPLGCV